MAIAEVSMHEPGWCFGLLLPPSKDKRPYRIHLLIPHRLRVWLLRQFVESEPNGALYGGTCLLLRLPFRDRKLVLQLLQKFTRDLLPRRFLGFGELRLWLGK